MVFYRKKNMRGKIFIKKGISDMLHTGLVMLICMLSQTAIAQNSYNATIRVPSDLSKETRQAVTDMAGWLNKLTGKPFDIKEGAADGTSIALVWAKTSSLPVKEKGRLLEDGQSFHLFVQGDKQAVITANGPAAFSNGIYTFLQELGFRWYMPGDNWTIVPATLNRQLAINRLYIPEFRNRFYAGSGGLRPIPDVDPANSFKADFDEWNLRNRFGLDYEAKGHAGQYFYTANKAVLDKNPAWFCKGKIDQYGRINIQYPAVVDLFVKWGVQQASTNYPYPIIGVDPSDGSGGADDCLPAYMPQIKTWSDKYFWLANQVAEKLQPQQRDVRVQLYAYASHADMPSFDIHEKVYPVIIPYAFQRITTPENFIIQWNRKMKGRAMGIYDYWNITQWSEGVPQFDIYSLPEKLRFWKRMNITGVYLESTYSKGAMGHAYWMAAQMMWNVNLNFDSLYNVFLKDCFGPAASDVRKMYDRWSRNYQEQMEVPLSLKNLADASQKTKDPLILARLAELKAYVHYLRLYYEYKISSTPQLYDQLVSYIKQIHSLRLVHTWALMSFYIKKPAGYNAAQGRSVTAPRAQELNRIIDQQFKEDLAKYATTYEVLPFKLDFSRIKPVSAATGMSVKNISGPNRYEFYVSASRQLQWKLTSTAAATLTIQDEQGSVVFEKKIPAGTRTATVINVQLKPGRYALLYGAFGAFGTMQFPAGIVFMSSGTQYYDNAGYPLQYIYVPRDAEYIIYQDGNGPGTNRRGYWVSPSGKKVVPEKLSTGIYKVMVPVGERGRVWTLDIGHRSFAIRNFPNQFSLTRFEYDEK